jgi:predicted ATP-grasp superfamily ATP-dependent carboligase
MPLMWVYEWTETIQAEYIQSLAMKMESVSEKKRVYVLASASLKTITFQILGI